MSLRWLHFTPKSELIMSGPHQKVLTRVNAEHINDCPVTISHTSNWMRTKWSMFSRGDLRKGNWNQPADQTSRRVPVLLYMPKLNHSGLTGEKPYHHVVISITFFSFSTETVSINYYVLFLFTDTESTNQHLITFTNCWLTDYYQNHRIIPFLGPPSYCAWRRQWHRQIRLVLTPCVDTRRPDFMYLRHHRQKVKFERHSPIHSTR